MYLVICINKCVSNNMYKLKSETTEKVVHLTGVTRNWEELHKSKEIRFGLLPINTFAFHCKNL